MHVLAPHGTVEQFPYSLGQLRKDNPQTSFPKNPSEALLASYNVFPVVSTGADYDQETQVATQEGCHYSTEKQRWETSWLIRDLTAEELAQIEADLAASVRSERDRKLQETDWIVIKSLEAGNPVPVDWEFYRQALRDITTQEGFPRNVTWPTKP